MAKRKMFTHVSRARLVFLRLQDADPVKVFAGLWHIVEVRGYKPGFAFFKFEEIFGYRPHFNKRVEPAMPTSDLLTWLANQRRNFGQRMKRIDAKRAEANAFILRRLDAILRDLEDADAQSGGIYRDTYDTEPYAIVDRIERQMIEHGAKGFLLPEAAE